MESIGNLLLFIQNLDPVHALLAVLSVFPWGFFFYMFQPESSRKTSVSLTALLAGILSTQIIMGLHPVFWPEVDFKPRKTSLL
ncbi:MAG TPA: hypothetical protein PK683_05540, partial [Leptospiraceae bacterium]|nr:hypothetical protein [Leptospiraceae bacterium]